MIIKDGAIIAGLDIRMRASLKVSDTIYNDYGQELTITCGLDGTHSSGSLHYYGLAIDIRTRYFDKATKNAVYIALKQELKNNYIVVLEKTHIHIQWRF